ncbi:MAG: hypothetical protein V3V14_10220 [Saprospiraceae bacterium]
MKYNIDNLLEKYWNAETSLQEETQLRSYFSSNDVAPEHYVHAPLFSFIGQQREEETNIDIFSTLTGIQSYDEIDTLVDQYLAVNTSLNDEAILKHYFASNNVKTKHKELIPLFYFTDIASNISSNIDIEKTILDYNNIDNLLDKYFNAETSLEEENTLKLYFSSNNIKDKHKTYLPMFQFLKQQSSVSSNTNIAKTIDRHDPSEIFDKEQSSIPVLNNKAKVINFRRLISALAAIFVIGFAAYNITKTDTNKEPQYKGKFVMLDSEEETAEALEITKQALAMLSRRMNTSSKTVSYSVSKAKTANIFR